MGDDVHMVKRCQGRWQHTLPGRNASSLPEYTCHTGYSQEEQHTKDNQIPFKVREWAYQEPGQRYCWQVD